jgi:hypothetical protein
MTNQSSELLYNWRFTDNHFVLATSPLRLTDSIFWTEYYFHSPYVTSSLKREWVRGLQLLLVIASAVLSSESRGTHDHILLSDPKLPQPGGPGPCIYTSPSNRVVQLYPQTPCSLFVASYDSQGYDGSIPPLLHTERITSDQSITCPPPFIISGRTEYR